MDDVPVRLVGQRETRPGEIETGRYRPDRLVVVVQSQGQEDLAPVASFGFILFSPSTVRVTMESKSAGHDARRTGRRRAYLIHRAEGGFRFGAQMGTPSAQMGLLVPKWALHIEDLP